MRNFGHRGTTASSYDVAGRVTVDANDYVGITWRGSDYWFAHANRTQLLAECADGRERSRWCLLLPVMAALASLGGVNRASVYEFFREHGPGGGLDSARVDAIADDELHLFDVRALTRRSSSATMDSGDE